MRRLPNKRKLTLIKRGNRAACWKCGNEIVSTGREASRGGGGAPGVSSCLYPSWRRQKGTGQLSLRFFFFFFKLSVFVSIWLRGWCKNTVEIGLETSRKLLVAGASCKRSPVVPGNRGLRQSHFSLESKFYFVSLGTRCSYSLTSGTSAWETCLFLFVALFKGHSIVVTNRYRKFNCISLEKFMCQIFKFKQGRKKGYVITVVFMGEEKKREKELDKKIAR